MLNVTLTEYRLKRIQFRVMHVVMHIAMKSTLMDFVHMYIVDNRI